MRIIYLGLPFVSVEVDQKETRSSVSFFAFRLFDLTLLVVVAAAAVGGLPAEFLCNHDYGPAETDINTGAREEITNLWRRIPNFSCSCFLLACLVELDNVDPDFFHFAKLTNLSRCRVSWISSSCKAKVVIRAAK